MRRGTNVIFKGQAGKVVDTIREQDPNDPTKHFQMVWVEFKAGERKWECAGDVDMAIAKRGK